MIREELIGIIDAIGPNGNPVGLMLGLKDQKGDDLEKVFGWVSNLALLPGHTLSRVTIVRPMKKKPHNFYVHPHLPASPDGSMQIGKRKVWFELVLIVSSGEEE
jgi:hypothetical protein